MSYTIANFVDLLQVLAPYAYQAEQLQQRAEELYNNRDFLTNVHADNEADSTAATAKSTFDAVREEIRQAQIQIQTQARAILLDPDLVTSRLPVPPNATYNDVAAALVRALLNIPDNGDATLANTAGLRVFGKTQSVTNVLNTNVTPSATLLDNAGTDSDETNYAGGVVLWTEADQTVLTADSGSVYPTLNDVSTSGPRLVVVRGLDGNSPPVTGAPSGEMFQGISNPFCPVSENLRIECSIDSETGGATPGNETYTMYSNKSGTKYSGQDEGTATSTSISTGYNDGLTLLPRAVQNFDNWTSNIPDGWTVVSGTAGTDFAETNDGTFRTGYPTGSKGSTLNKPDSASFEIVYSLESEKANIKRNSFYVLSYWVTGAADGISVEIVRKSGSSYVTSTNFTAQTTAQYSTSGTLVTGDVTASNVTTIYQTGSDLSDEEYYIRIDDGASDTAAIGALQLLPVQWVNGLGFCIVEGLYPAQAGRGFEIIRTSDRYYEDDSGEIHYAGHVADFFARYLNIALPTRHDYDDITTSSGDNYLTYDDYFSPTNSKE